MTENIEKIIENCGASLYDTQSVIENNHKIFRVYITCKNGVTLEKCEEISKILSPIFDLNPPVEGHYFLEVSSPGIERSLKIPKHFMASIGELVNVKLKNKDIISGKIVFANHEEFELENEEKHKIKYEDILKAKTYFEWK